MMNFYAVNNQLVLAPTQKDAIDLYYASLQDDWERNYLEQFEW